VKLPLDKRNQSAEGGFVALTPFQKQSGGVRGVVRNVAILSPFDSSPFPISEAGRWLRGGPHRLAARSRYTGRRHLMSLICRAGLTALMVVGSVAAPAEAEIIRFVVTSVERPTFEGMSFGTVGQYEKLRGRAFGEVDPDDPRNAIITDIEFAPKNARGMVEYSMDVLILKPIDLSRGNGQLLYHMNNRGNIGFLFSLNNGSLGNNPTYRSPRIRTARRSSAPRLTSSSWTPAR
jgi:hypothetical protein